MQIKAASNRYEGVVMIYAANNSLSALTAFVKKMNVTANNIANALTDQFKKSRVTMEENSPSGVKAVVDRVTTPGFPKETLQDGKSMTVESSNVDLTEELPEMVITKTAYQANLKTLKTQDDMMGALLDIFS
jgi:flagellar hook protein FlgE